MIELTNTAIKTHRIAPSSFTSICSRYQAFRRQWDETLRKIEAGTYERHRFKAKLTGRGPAGHPRRPSPRAPRLPTSTRAYVDASARAVRA